MAILGVIIVKFYFIRAIISHKSEKRSSLLKMFSAYSGFLTKLDIFHLMKTYYEFNKKGRC